ncbi:MAG TPA: ABC transporter ATP-binding protein, partial [Microbacteriaceae bacterium]|nr:ABC transporter ATP-binding protein [Microbacteriaceae bacterium]
MTVHHGSAAAVEAKGWGWRHAGRADWAVSGLDLRIEPGERVLLLGASGAGKSTLVHALAGVLGGDDEGERAGKLLVGGVRPEDARGRVGLVLQDPDSQVVLARVGDDVAFGCENLGIARNEIWRRVAGALEAVGLDLPLAHPTSRLSGGQKQRLALAGVLSMRPGLVLLDEPTANL